MSLAYNSASAPNPVNTEMSADTASSDNNAEPKKPSIRTLVDKNQLTREEDLSQGPLLFCIGAGQEHPEWHPQLEFEELDHQPEGSHDRTVQSIPLIPPTVLPLQAASQSELSDSGMLYSIPTDGLSSTNFSRQHETAGSQTQMTESGSDTGALPLYPWEYVFSWGNSSLLFDNEPLDVARAAETLSLRADMERETTSLASSMPAPHTQAHQFSGCDPQILVGTGLFNHDAGEPCDFQEVRWDLETASATSLVHPRFTSESTLGIETSTQAPDPVQAAIALDEIIDWTVEVLLDWYVRSYVPQESQKWNNTARNQNAGLAGCDQGINKRGKAFSSGRQSNPRKRKTTVDSDESEDEGSHDEKPGSSRKKSSKNSCPLACPFMRWKPGEYLGRCLKPIRTITHLKQHLIKKHYNVQCQECYRMDDGVEKTDHKCNRPTATPVGFITPGKLEAIQVRANRLDSIEEQWQYYYQSIFPSAPPCPLPFLDDYESEVMLAAEQAIRSPKAWEILRKELAETIFPIEDISKVEEIVWERWIPRLFFVKACRNSQASPNVLQEVANDDGQPAEPDRFGPALMRSNISLYFKSAEIINVIQGIIEDSNYQGGDPSKVFEFIHVRLFPLLSSLPSQHSSDGDVRTFESVTNESAQDYDQSAEPGYSHQTEVPNEGIIIVPQTSGSCDLQQSFNFERFDNHSRTEGVEGWEHSNTAGTIYQEPTESATLDVTWTDEVLCQLFAVNNEV